ncbi:MAG: efflux RND transporter periplasmic adaptor subunit [Gemmataceae bacterium]|nr:efflux RND transporter periplasmic adaptor subunit [Gemmataceae bacterium]MCI0743754.1 efflux RND transporter periplasmic adaptor subunit [Gemmataceae bacterium]
MYSLTTSTKSLAVLAAAFVLAGCSNEPTLAPTPTIEVLVSQPVLEKIADWDVYTGTVDAKESLEVRARVRGHIKDVRFTEGEEIAAGKDLYVIDADPFQADLKQAQGQLSTWEAKLKLAEEKIAFYKPLAEKGSVSKEELLKVIADKEESIGGIATTRGKILEAELNIGYCTIKSEIAGKVGEALFTKGDLVNSSGADSLLTTIVGVDPMYVYFYVHERIYQDYRKLLLARSAKEPTPPGTKLKIPVEMAIGSDPNFAYKGFVDFVDNRVDPATSSIKVRAKFDNPKGPDGRRLLTAGLFARLRITLAEPYLATLVADRAILADQSLKYVLVVNKANKNVVERVDIEPANRVQENGLRVVNAGLKGGEWVIVEGVNRARPGASVAPKDGPMPRRPTPKN